MGHLFANNVLAATGAVNEEGWREIAELGLALLLSTLIGLEREYRQKSAGLRTHTLVGIGSALFMLISKYGFTDVLEPGRVIVDPSRVAAQIVTGIGFLGAGIIFVRQGSVRGLTTAAAVWVTAAVGAASGAGLPVLAAVTTAIYFVVAVAYPMLARRLPNSTTAAAVIKVRYPDGKGVLRDVLHVASSRGFSLGAVATETVAHRVAVDGSVIDGVEGTGLVEVTMQVHGRGSVHELVAALSELPLVDAVVADDREDRSE